MHLPKLLAVDTLPGMVRQTNTELLDRLDGQRRGLAFQGIKIDGERRRAGRRVDGVEAGLSVSSKNALPAAIVTDAPSGLWTIMS